MPFGQPTLPLGLNVGVHSCGRQHSYRSIQALGGVQTTLQHHSAIRGVVYLDHIHQP